MKRGVRAAVVAAILIGPSLPASAGNVPDVKTLRAQIAAARGAAPDNYRETITLQTGDGTIATFRTYKRGHDVRTVEDAGPIHTESGVAGSERWHQDENGITVADDPVPNEAPAASGAGTVSSTADALIISNLDKNGFGLRQYVDPASYRIFREDVLRPSGTLTTTYVYGTYGTQTLTSHWTTTDEATKVTRTYARLERVAGVATAAQVAEPGLRRPLVDFPNVQPVALPATFENGTITVAVTIAGHPLTFSLDSGAAGIVLDGAAATALGLKPIERYASTDAQSPQRSEAVVPSLRIGPLGMHDIVVSIAPLAQSNPGSKSIDGELGFDFLATIGLRIDYQHATLTAIPLPEYAPPAGPDVVHIDVRLGQQVPMTTVALDGIVADRFVVDTGATGAVSVYDAFMDRHPDVGTRGSLQLNGYGLDGTAYLRPFTVQSFRLGTWTFPNFEGYRIGRGRSDQGWDGFIGSAFLQLFDVELDYPHGRIYLTPTTNTKQMLHLR